MSVLQSICRSYLRSLRVVACRHGLVEWLDGVLQSNARGECEATEREVELLSRCVDDERLPRASVPHVLGKSYRRCVDDGDFDMIRTLRHVGIYSKVSTLLLAGREIDEDGLGQDIQ